MLHPDLKSSNERRDSRWALGEAVALAEALPGIDVIGQTAVVLAKPRPATLFGTGKVAELGEMFAAAETELVLVDGSLTPVQQRNLEKEWKVKILDRTALILEIFADRARTREGVLQVEMAALTYQRTRLVRAWTHLERQRGGLGFVGGPGETQIEADRRAIDEMLVRIRRQLEKVVKTRTLHRASRAKVPFPVVALVGYTNAGKSTLFNRVTGADVLAKDMLFATLDPTMRSMELPSGPQIILSDTVGFISDLPTELVASFRATLEEVLSADLILHVRDISHPETDRQSQNVKSILGSLGVELETPLFEVWNKVDLLSDEERQRVENRAARNVPVYAISALTGDGIDRLLEDIGEQLQGTRVEENLELGFADGRKRAWLFEQDIITAETQTETGYDITVLWTERQKRRFQAI